MKEKFYSLRCLENRSTTSVQLKSRDVSHLTDTQHSARLKEQIKEKQLNAQVHFSQYVQKQRLRKQNEAYFSTQVRVKTEEVSKGDSPHDIMPLLESLSELNFNQLLEDLTDPSERSAILNNIKQQIQSAVIGTPSLVSIKQKSSHFFSTEPTGRRDAIMLKSWLVGFLEETLKQKNKEQKEKLISVSEAIYLCLQEVVRQVSYTCTERGQLLNTLIKGYILVFHKQFELLEKEKRKLKFQMYEQELLEERKYDTYTESLKSEITKLKSQLDEIHKRDCTIQLERNTYHQTINKLQHKIDINSTIQRNAAKLIGDLQREVAQLKHQLTKKHTATQSINQDEPEEQDLSLSQVLKEVNQLSKYEQNQDIIVKDVVEVLPIVSHTVGVQTFSKCLCVMETQTDLKLLSSSYDKFLSIQELDNTIKEFELKQHLDQQSTLDGLFDQINLHQDEISIQEIDLKQIKKIDYIQEASESDELSPDPIFKRSKQQFDKRQVERSESSDIERFGSDKLLKVKQVQYASNTLEVKQQSSQQSSERMIKLSPSNNNNSCKSSVKQTKQQKYFTATENEKKVLSPKQKNKRSSIQQSLTPPLQSSATMEQEKQDTQTTAIPQLSKTQTTMLMLLYQIQKQKAQNATQKVSEVSDLSSQILLFARKLTLHILKTQFKTHTQIAEEFLFEFESLRKKTMNDQEILEEEYVLDEEKEKEQKKQEDMKRRKGKISRALRFNYAAKQLKTTPTIDRLVHPGVILAVKARDQSHLFKKVVSYWPVKNVLRTITQIYTEKTGGEADMQIFVFNFFLNKYGFKHVAEKKYLQFLLSVIHFSQIFRVNIFARLMCLLHDEQTNFTQEETVFFLTSLDYIQNQTVLGVNIVQGDSETKFHVPYLRVLDYIKVHLENKLLEDEVKELRNELENLKEPDPKNKSGIVDIDLFMLKVLDKYRNVTHRTKLFVIHAFQAADLDGNKKINHNEFLTLFRHIESEKFNFQEALELFDDQADIVHQGEKNLSFNRFTSVCVNHQIFTEAALNEFIGGETNIEESFNLIIKNWNTYKSEVQGLLGQLQPYVTPEIYQEWINILYTLEKRILHQKNEVSSMRPIMIAHKILKLELTRLLVEDEQIQNKE